ncbi:induced myeloid leukemia cell differentiation protein Mcl-1-like [Sphaeramia orbicularis]|uniref:Induced myeloid leukemia cell differentiation protein Mcl-1-like n=1 Tax=Sphaeramia orbicularis TaxID=375764 RepID=A0A673A8P7_9TELE|nr:induced myeloid leukemia cell differentiation protein Mcl-1-like [Sphaeramia orbicularis]XP_030015100.1 induced myeloid leukemia cell differentiation protein Mcl-1-like [Sphaeramia orbicularis]
MLIASLKLLIKMNIIPPSKRTAFGIMSVSLLHQNGVADPFGAEDSAQFIRDSAQFNRASALDSRNSNPQHRPNNLGVKAKNEHLPKSLQEDRDEADADGSLPCTPEFQSLEPDVPSCPAGHEVLEADTRQLIIGFLKVFTGVSKPRWSQNEALSTMKRVVEDLLEKHRYAYNGMINKLSLDDRGDDMRFVSAVATSLFEDGTTNWGRVASLVAFGAVVCQYLKKKGRENCVELVGEEISAYLLSDQRDWLLKNNSWDGFVEFFRVSDPESTVRNTLMTVAGLAGIGATLAMLIR